MIDVSCILINYNSSEYTIKCVASILENTQEDITYEIVVVDNASTPENYDIVVKGIEKINSPKVKLIRSLKNTGFGGGNMTGVQHASLCRYFAFINNDTLMVSPNTLKELVHFMETHPNAGMSSPQMLDHEKGFRRTIDHFASPAREILKRGFLEFVNPKRYPNRKRTYKQPLKVDYVQGAFMFADAEIFNAVGGFDTNLFLYYEESDVCRRMWKQKQKIAYLVPHLEYIHYESASSSSNITMKIEQKISLFYYLRKHYGAFWTKIVQIYFCVRYFFRAIFKPKYWKLFRLLLAGMPLSHSLKQKQPVLDA
ncbi:glycosyltransferase family 2 protein [Aureisphaera galaxeae]|uniref:glycosyltransferase family 2 protein n=1 Tax=Aureisphaera galaxeae TaxID=1538023 RepID=UPI002350CC3C|nr:glycosyltransferase family 2 protein [Aureisphaera galaxeae]MDC8003433.1 glycosyltransferase family 2 protein [Aureisphaera galaxeae]